MVYLCLMDRCKAQKSLVFVGGFRIQKKSLSQRDRPLAFKW